MILPDYKVNIIKKYKSSILINIEFNKVTVTLDGDAKHESLDLRFIIKKGVRRRNVSLLKYFKAIYDFLISSNCYLSYYENKYVNLFDPNRVKSICLRKLKITSGDMECIKEHYKNLRYFETDKCTIYKQANIGILNCRVYKDYKSDIISLDSYNGFSGRNIYFQKSHILSNNKHILHLYSTTLTLNNTNLDFEKFILMLDAPNLRKLEIFNKKELDDKDLLFISGLYNLEMLDVDANLTNADQIKKLERLRDTSGISISGNKELEKVKAERKEHYEFLKSSGKSEEEIKQQLMYQYMGIYKKYLDLLNKLYVKRLDRVKWENKIHAANFDRIQKELLEIANMSYEDRKNIAKETKEFNLQDSLDNLCFDKIPEREEDIRLTNSRPFQENGIDYFIKRKKLLLLK